MSIWVYPGSFDPITIGHMDIIVRGARLCDTLYVAVTDNLAKKHAFDIDERIDFIKRSTAHIENVKIESYSTLLVDYAKAKGVHAILRGVRNQTDFEYEGNLAHVNRKLYEKADTVFINATAHTQCISSSVVREIMEYNGDITGFVAEEIKNDVINIYNRRNGQ